jgi:hypothetical protein
MKGWFTGERMRIGLKSRWTIAVGMAALSAGGQSVTVAGSAASSPRILISAPGLVSVPPYSPGQLVRIIDDPSLGDRWLLIRDPNHPGGPGRLVLASRTRSEAGRNGSAGVPDVGKPGADQVLASPVIHTGDLLVVEENTAVVEARLEAVALGPAWAGSSFDVRLKIGGKVVRAIALASGRAVFSPETEVLR